MSCALLPPTRRKAFAQCHPRRLGPRLRLLPYQPRLLIQCVDTASRKCLHLGSPGKPELPPQRPRCLDGVGPSHLYVKQLHLGLGGVKEQAERFDITAQADNVVGGVDKTTIVGKDGRCELAGDKVFAVTKVCLENSLCVRCA